MGSLRIVATSLVVVSIGTYTSSRCRWRERWGMGSHYLGGSSLAFTSPTLDSVTLNWAGVFPTSPDFPVVPWEVLADRGNRWERLHPPIGVVQDASMG